MPWLITWENVQYVEENAFPAIILDHRSSGTVFRSQGPLPPQPRRPQRGPGPAGMTKVTMVIRRVPMNPGLTLIE